MPLLLFSRNHRATNKRRCSPPVVILVISARTSLSPASSSRHRNYASASVSVITLPDPAPIADGLPMTQRSPLVRFAARRDLFSHSRVPVPRSGSDCLDLFAKEEFRRLAHEFNAKADQLDFRPGTPDGLDGGTNRPSHTLGSGNVRSWRALRVLSARSNLLSGLKGNVGTMAGCKVQRPATERASRPARRLHTTEIFRVY